MYLDIDPGPRPPGSPPLPNGWQEVWITEATIGGGGIIEQILQAFTGDPRRFFRIAESALAATDFEIVDRELTRLLALNATDTELNAAFDAVRSAPDHAVLVAATLALHKLLSRRGMVVNHPVMSAIHTRILRPGRSPASDALLRRLIQDWNTAEDQLGIEIDPRVYAYIATQSAAVQAELALLGGVPSHDAFWRFQTIYGLLWPRGSLVRAQGLSFYNPFAEGPLPDRDLLLDLLRAGEPTVALATGWEAAVAQVLTSRGAVCLTANPANRRELKEALLHLAAEPVEANHLHLHPNVVGVNHDPAQIAVTLDLREVMP